MPYGENYCQLQLLFVFDCYRPSASFKKTVFQWTLSLVSAVGLVGNAVHFTLHPDLRVPYPEPCSISDTLWNPSRGSGMEDPRIISTQFNSPKMPYYNVLVNI